MAQNKTMFYFAVGLLLMFGLSLFGVFLSVPAQNDLQGVSPTPAGPQYKGFGTGKAKVVTLGGQLLIQCVSAQSTAVDAVKSIYGVQTAFKASNDLLVAVVNTSVEGPIVAEGVYNSLLDKCSAIRILRSSLIDFTEPVKLVNSPESAVTGERTIYPLEARAYGLRTAQVPGVVAYLDAFTAVVNSTFDVYVSATLTGSQVDELLAEQSQVSQPTVAASPSPDASNSTQSSNSSAAVNETGGQQQGLNSSNQSQSNDSSNSSNSTGG